MWVCTAPSVDARSLEVRKIILLCLRHTADVVFFLFVALMDDKKMMRIEFFVPSGKDNYERLVIHIKENYTYSSITEFVCAWYGLSSKKCVFRQSALVFMVY